MVKSICGQDFAYMHEVEDDRQRSSQTRARKYYKSQRRCWLKQFSVLGQNLNAAGSFFFFYRRPSPKDLQSNLSYCLTDQQNIASNTHAARGLVRARDRRAKPELPASGAGSWAASNARMGQGPFGRCQHSEQEACGTTAKSERARDRFPGRIATFFSMFFFFAFFIFDSLSKWNY
jgi:hypothetical protein